MIVSCSVSYEAYMYYDIHEFWMPGEDSACLFSDTYTDTQKTTVTRGTSG